MKFKVLLRSIYLYVINENTMTGGKNFLKHFFVCGFVICGFDLAS